MDKEGNSVRRQIKKEDLSYFQTKIYEIGKKYIPTLQRATNYKELGLKAPRHLSHREFRTKKVKETQLNLVPKIQAIKKENKELKEENKELLARVKDLKEENKRIREEFKNLGAKREDYAKLEQLVRELKEKIKAKELTIEEMQKEFNKQLQELKTKLKEEQEKNEELRKELNYITAPVDKEEFKDIVVENSILLDELNTKTDKIENTCEKIKWKEWYSILDSEIKPIEKENEKTKEELKETKNINEQLKEKIHYFEFWNKKNELIEKGYVVKIIFYKLKLIEKRLKTLEDKLKELINEVIQKLENTNPNESDYIKNLFSKFLNNSNKQIQNKISSNHKNKIKR